LRREAASVLIVLIAMLLAWLSALLLLKFSTVAAGVASGGEPLYSTSADVSPRGMVLARAELPDSCMFVPTAVNAQDTSGPLVTLQDLRTGGCSNAAGTTWTTRQIARANTGIFLQHESEGSSDHHLGAYEATTATTSARVLAHHVVRKNLRQRSLMKMTSLGLGRAPVLVGESLFWRGPRVLVYDGNHYSPSRDLLLITAAGLRESFLTLGLFAACVFAAITAGCGVPRPFARDVTQSLVIAAWVLILLRLAMGLIQGDILYTLAWLSPAVGAGVFLVILWINHAITPSRHS
jgi:hypothetical protein